MKTKKLLSILLSSIFFISCNGGTNQTIPDFDNEIVNEKEERESISEKDNTEDTSEPHVEEVKVLEHVHTIVKEEVKPTCTEGGYLKEECADEDCDYSFYEEYEPLGHNIVNEVISNTHISYGNHFEKATAYSMCSRCKTRFEPFEYGNSTFLFDTFIEDYCYKYINVGQELETELRTVYKTLANDINDQFNNSVFEDKDDYENKLYAEIKVSKDLYNVVNTYRLFEVYLEQNPWLQDPTMFCPNSSVDYNTWSSKLYYYFPLRKGNHTPALRKQKLKVFDSIYSQCDSLIRKGASEIERIIAIYSVVGQTFSYKADVDNLFTALRNSKKGNCQAYARLFVHLCNRYGISSFYQTNVNHAFNRVCVGNRWYFLEPQNYGQQYGKFQYFLSTNYGSPRQNYDFSYEIEERMGNISNLRNGFFSVYKNENLLGVYFDLDETLKNLVQDPNADYKITFGLTKVCNGKISYDQGVNFVWSNSYSDSKFKSLLFTTEVNSIKSSNKNLFNISSELFNKENVKVENIKYTVV